MFLFLYSIYIVYVSIYIFKYIYMHHDIHSSELEFHGILLPYWKILCLRQERYLDFKRELDGALEKFRSFMLKNYPP